MIRLDNTTRTLQALLSGSVTTNQLNTTTSYSDATSSTFTGATTVINTNNTTAVTLAAAPSAGIVRTIDSVNVFNADTVSQTVTVRYNDNGTFYPLVRTTLLTGETLGYTHGFGWFALDVNGNRKQVTSTVFSSVTVTGTATVGSNFTIDSASALQWGSSGVTSPDLFLRRGNANSLEQRNGTASQSYFLYNTYTTPADYERFDISWGGGVLTFRTSADGSGTVRNMTFGNTSVDGAAKILFTGLTKGTRFGTQAGYSSIEGVDSTGSISYQPLQVGGSALALTINGSAVWNIGATNFNPQTDASADIGTSLLRVRDIYISRDIYTAGGAQAVFRSATTLNNNAGVGAGTLLNAPSAGNPTKWIAINDNGTTRYIPTWT
jgi:hypothetical protein